MIKAVCGNTGVIYGSDMCLYCVVHSCHGYKEAKERERTKVKDRRLFLKEFVHWWRETHEPHHMTDDELWEKAGTREPITRKDIGLPPGSQDGLESPPYW